MSSFTRRVRLAVFAAVTGLSLSCPSGDKGRDDTGVCETPGYGTLGLSFVMADAYSESVKDQVDDGMLLSIDHVPDPIDSCDDYQRHRYDDVSSMTTGLGLVMDFQVPVGQTCGELYGDIPAEDQPGYIIACEGELDLTNMRECARTEAAIVVTCVLTTAVDTSDGA